jgi:hypothetical protein
MDKLAPIQLKIQTGPASGRLLTIGQKRVTIGRSEQCDYHVDDPALSRQHAALYPSPGGHVLEDLGSTNGTFINGRRLQGPALIQIGDIIQLGKHVELMVQAAAPNTNDESTFFFGAVPPGTTPPSKANYTDTLKFPRQAMGHTAPPSQNRGLWIGLVVVVVLIGGALVYLLSGPTTSPPKATVVAKTPSATGTTIPESFPTPTSLSIKVPGILVGTVTERVVPAEMTNVVDPFCNDTLELETGGDSIYVYWKQPLAPADATTDYQNDWLNHVYYDLTLDGRPLKFRFATAADGLELWGVQETLASGAHYLKIEQFADREISTGLDTNPADGEPDRLGPGPIGEGYCEVVLAEPVALATATPSPTPTSAPPSATPTSANTPTPISTPTPWAAPVGVFNDFETASAWRRGDEPYGELTQTSSQAHGGSYAGQLSYNFPGATNDYVVFRQARTLAGRPNAISAWVYGDGAGHYLNLWLKDANGQVWQMSFGQIKHTGWQEMTAFLDPGQPWPSGHVSGTDNGAIDYPISFDSLVLDDAPDSFSGRGTLYIDDLTSREGASKPKPPTATVAPTAGPVVIVVTATPAGGAQLGSGGSGGLYRLRVGGQHRYEEPWGAPGDGDPCNSWRNDSWDDKNPNFRGFNLELLLTNNSDTKIADEWAETMSFITANNKEVLACYYGYTGMGPAPKGETSVTFFTVVERGDYVRNVYATINGQQLRLCLGPDGAEVRCY